MENINKTIIDTLLSCISEFKALGSYKDDKLKGLQHHLEIELDRLMVEGKSTDDLCNVIDRIKNIRFDV
jgi:uncharacterized protein YajQ (UPF0234 family)